MKEWLNWKSNCKTRNIRGMFNQPKIYHIIRIQERRVNYISKLLIKEMANKCLHKQKSSQRRLRKNIRKSKANCRRLKNKNRAYQINLKDMKIVAINYQKY